MSLQLVHFSSCGPDRPSNQDAYAVRILRTPLGLISLLLVCDGMGGLSYGDIASATVVESFCSWFDHRFRAGADLNPSDDAVSSEWNGIVSTCHDQIQRFSAAQGVRSGTTLSAILLLQNRFCLMHVGDSRIYLAGRESIRLLTKDQTLARQELDAGHITDEQYSSDERSHVLLQCIGCSRVAPSFQTGSAPSRGSVLLCSDGFYHGVATPELHNAMEGGASKAELQSALFELFRRGRLQGETDNATCVCLKWEPDAGEHVSGTEQVAAVTFTNAESLGYKQKEDDRECRTVSF